MQLTTPEIILWLALTMMMGSATSFERQHKNRLVGIRTHILVCVDAAIIVLIRSQIATNALKNALANPTLTGVIRSDQARSIAQIVSGIGFLDAGTIIVTRQSATGLTTAASLWIIVGLGIAAGMGHYTIVLASFIGVLFALTIVKRIIHIPMIKRLETHYQRKQGTKEFINQYFEEKHIGTCDVNSSISWMDDTKVYTNIYIIDLLKGLIYTDIIEDLSVSDNVTKLRLTNVQKHLFIINDKRPGQNRLASRDKKGFPKTALQFLENFGSFPKKLVLFPSFISFEYGTKIQSDLCPTLFSSRTQDWFSKSSVSKRL